MRRILPVVFAVNLVHVGWFLLVEPTDATMARWRDGILLVHSLMAAFGATAMAASWWTTRRGGRVAAWAVDLATASFPAFGAWLAGVDQLVTPSVTPLIVTGLGAALAIHQRPRIAAVTYLAQLGLALVLFQHYQLDPAVRTSNVVNAVSICALGWIIARQTETSWRVALEHRHTIGAQASRLREANAELATLARTDALTGLMNRRALLEQAEPLLGGLRARGAGSAVLLLDVDHFKRVNDDFGHAAGDDVLRTLVERVRGVLSHDDLFARLGGEEFVVVLADAGQGRAQRVAEAVRASVRAAPIVLGESELQVTVSIGVAELHPETEANLLEALAHADVALYEAKRSGRDRVIVHRPAGV